MQNKWKVGYVELQHFKIHKNLIRNTKLSCLQIKLLQLRLNTLNIFNNEIYLIVHNK